MIDRELNAQAFLVLLPIAFLLAGIGIMVAGRRKAARRARMRRQAESGLSPFAPGDTVLDSLPDFTVETGPVALPAQTSRWGRVLGFTALAAFWNGIVAVFANQALESFDRGSPDWFLTLFLVPLVLAIFHALLTLLNPKPKLVVSTRTPRLGERVDLQWSFTGRTGRSEQLRIVL